MQLDVNRQHHGAARRGRVGGQLANCTATGRRFDLINTRCAVKLLLKALLYTELADVVGAAVVALLFAVVDGFFFSRVDAANVAHHMAAQLAIRVAAKQPRLDVHAGVPKTLRCKPGNLFIRQACANRQRLKVFGFFTQPLEAFFIARLDINQFFKLGNRVVNTDDVGRHDLQGVGRIIGRQNHAVAVQNQPAVWHDGHDGRAVAFSLFVKVCVAVHLQIHQPCRQQRKSAQHHQHSHQHPHAKARQVGFNVSKFSHCLTWLANC